MAEPVTAVSPEYTPPSPYGIGAPLTRPDSAPLLQSTFGKATPLLYEVTTMWGLLAGIAGAVMLGVIHLRRRGARHKHKRIDVGPVSEGWVAQQRGNSDPEG